MGCILFLMEPQRCTLLLICQKGKAKLENMLMLLCDLLRPQRETIRLCERTATALKGSFFFFLINRIHLSVIKPFHTVQVLKTSVNVFVRWQNVKTIVIARQTKTQCITKERVHPSGWHNKEISAILLLQDEVNHLLYR